MNKNHYEVFGLPASASLLEIKKRYRILALKYHPDRNNCNPEFNEKFRQIQEIYGVLSDPVKRQYYDQTIKAQFRANEDVKNTTSAYNGTTFSRGAKTQYGKSYGGYTENTSRPSWEQANKNVENGFEFNNEFIKTLGRILVFRLALPAFFICAATYLIIFLFGTARDQSVRSQGNSQEIHFSTTAAKSEGVEGSRLNHNSSQYSVKPPIPDGSIAEIDSGLDEQRWEKISISTGGKPECENINPRYSKNIENELLVYVGDNTDAIIKLIDKKTDRCIRIVYISAGDNYSIKNIPLGSYYVKIAYGKDFRKSNVDGECRVKFMKDAAYKVSDEDFTFTRVKKVKSDGSYWSVSSYTLWLDLVAYSGNGFKSSSISESDFNK